jgi:hypothetical protein
MNSQNLLRPLRTLVVGAIFLFALLVSSCQKEELLGNAKLQSGDPSSVASDQGDNGNIAVSERTPTDPHLLLKLILDGAYVHSPNQWMRDNLRTLATFPLTKTSPISGTVSTIGGGVLGVSGANAIVDWVLVELRSSANNQTILFDSWGLVQRDGDVVDPADGTSALSFPGATASYFISVKHRNHMGCMTSISYNLTVTPGTIVDLTSNSTGTWSSATAVGTRWATGSSNTKRSLFQGDATSPTPDKRVIFQGSQNDPIHVFFRVMTDLGNTAQSLNYIVSNVYDQCDVNLDGKVIYAGPANDVAPISFSVFASSLNPTFLPNFIVNQAIP